MGRRQDLLLYYVKPQRCHICGVGGPSPVSSTTPAPPSSSNLLACRDGGALKNAEEKRNYKQGDPSHLLLRACGQAGGVECVVRRGGRGGGCTCDKTLFAKRGSPQARRRALHERNSTPPPPLTPSSFLLRLLDATLQDFYLKRLINLRTRKKKKKYEKKTQSILFLCVKEQSTFYHAKLF